MVVSTLSEENREKFIYEKGRVDELDYFPGKF